MFAATARIKLLTVLAMWTNSTEIYNTHSCTLFVNSNNGLKLFVDTDHISVAGNATASIRLSVRLIVSTLSLEPTVDR